MSWVIIKLKRRERECRRKETPGRHRQTVYGSQTRRMWMRTYLASILKC